MRLAMVALTLALAAAPTIAEARADAPPPTMRELRETDVVPDGPAVSFEDGFVLVETPERDRLAIPGEREPGIGPLVGRDTPTTDAPRNPVPTR